MDRFLLVTFGIIVLAMMVGAFIWYFVFGRSVKRVVFSLVGIFFNRGEIDLDQPIYPSDEKTSRETLEAHADEYDFDTALRQAKPTVPQAMIPPQERGDLARDTSDNGWPRQLDKDTRTDTRPFRHVHLQTENEEIQQKIRETGAHQVVQLDNTDETDA